MNFTETYRTFGLRVAPLLVKLSFDAFQRRDTSERPAAADAEIVGNIFSAQKMFREASKGMIPDAELKHLVRLYLRAKRFEGLREPTERAFVYRKTTKHAEKSRRIAKVSRLSPMGIHVTRRGKAETVFWKLVGDDWPMVWRIEKFTNNPKIKSEKTKTKAAKKATKK